MLQQNNQCYIKVWCLFKGQHRGTTSSRRKCLWFVKNIFLPVQVRQRRREVKDATTKMLHVLCVPKSHCPHWNVEKLDFSEVKMRPALQDRCLLHVTSKRVNCQAVNAMSFYLRVKRTLQSGYLMNLPRLPFSPPAVNLCIFPRVPSPSHGDYSSTANERKLTTLGRQMFCGRCNRKSIASASQ